MSNVFTYKGIRVQDLISAGVARACDRTRNRLASGRITRVMAACQGWQRQAEIYHSLQYNQMLIRYWSEDRERMMEMSNQFRGYANFLEFLIPDEA